jgi:thioredoxin reductase
MTGIWKDASRFKKAAEAIRSVAGAGLSAEDELLALAECAKKIDLNARINELEAIVTDLDDAEAPAAVAAFLRRVRRNLENKIAAMQHERGDHQGDGN